MKEKPKKIIKWSLFALASLLLLSILTVLIFGIIMYSKVYEGIPYVEKSGGYSWPELDESEIIPIEGSVDEDESQNETGDEVSVEDDTSENDGNNNDDNKGNKGSSGVAKETPIYIVEPIDKTIINVLLIGRDVYSSSGGNGRSDSMMVLSYNKNTGKVSINSLLRDSLVPIENHGWNRLNASYSWGGAGLTINTINDVYGLDIQHYISIDYNGFINLIDKIEGVTVFVSKKEADYMNRNYGKNYTEGEVSFDGKMALEFARIRKGLGDDWGRTERQRRIIVAAMNKVLELDNVGDIVTLINDNIRFVKTNLSSGTIISLAYDFFDKNNSNIETDVIPAKDTWYYATYRGMSIIKINFDENKRILHERIYR